MKETQEVKGKSKEGTDEIMAYSDCSAFGGTRGIWIKFSRFYGKQD
jgi:hypothetical protein